MSKGLVLKDLIFVHEQNGKFLIQEEKLNVVYALIQERLSSQLYGDRKEIPSNLVSKLIEEHQIELTTFKSFKALFQYIKLHLAVAQARNNYYGFIDRIIEQYEFVKSVQQDSERQEYYHARLLYSITNTLFRIKDFKACQEYNEKLSDLIFKPSFAYRERFKYKYILMAALCENYLGDNKAALDTLGRVKLEKVPDFRDRCDIHTIRFLFLMHAEEHAEAKKWASKMFHSDKYYEDRMGVDWLMKFRLIEIILFFELQESDLLESRIRSFKRAFFKYLKDSDQERVVQFLKIVEKIFMQPELVHDAEFKGLMEASIGADKPTDEDAFVQSYYGWLKSKVENRNVYEVTLELAHSK